MSKLISQDTALRLRKVKLCCSFEPIHTTSATRELFGHDAECKSILYLLNGLFFVQINTSCNRMEMSPSDSQSTE